MLWSVSGAPVHLQSHGVSLMRTAPYQHLGGIVAAIGSMAPEVAQRPIKVGIHLVELPPIPSSSLPGFSSTTMAALPNHCRPRASSTMLAYGLSFPPNCCTSSTGLIRDPPGVLLACVLRLRASVFRRTLSPRPSKFRPLNTCAFRAGCVVFAVLCCWLRLS